MLSFYAFYCPYCKHHLSSTNHPNSYGTPLKLCPKCGKTYLDSYCTEHALKEYRPVTPLKRALSAGFLSLFPAALLGALVSGIAQSNSAFWLPFGIAFLAFWIFLFARAARNRERIEQRRLKEWQESDKRLRDPSYATILENFGYKVPSRYLPPNFTPDPDSLPYQAAWVRKPGSARKRPCTKPDPAALSGFF